jgi:hypothetical protein
VREPAARSDQDLQAGKFSGKKASKTAQSAPGHTAKLPLQARKAANKKDGAGKTNRKPRR